MGKRGASQVRLCRLLVAVSALSVVTATAASTAYAQEASRRFDVPAQPLSSALLTLGRQAGISISAPRDLTRGRTSRAVAGNLSTRDAIGRMLEGTGLRFEFVNGSAVRIFAGGSAATNSGEGEAGGAAADNDGAGQQGVSEILVVGRRTLNADVRRTEDDVQPYVVINGQDIQNSGAVNLEEFLRNRLSANAQQSAPGQSPVSAQGGDSGQSISTLTAAGSIDLRGLGNAQTLILVDGRRLPSVRTLNNFDQPNLTGIPLSAIERIEILPSTAGGIYGGGATGGVVNIILRRDYSGLDLDLRVGDTARFDASQVQLGLNGGFALEGGRTRVSFFASHAHQGELAQRERDFRIRAGARTLQNVPLTSTTLCAGGTYGSTPNICSVNGGNLVLDAGLGGQSLGSNATFVPVGYAGPASDRGAGLISNAGRLNFDDGRTALLQPSDSSSAGLTIRREFGSRIEAFLDLYWDRIDRSLDSYLISSLGALTVPANDAANPFQQDVVVSLPLEAYPLLSRFSLENLRARAGVIARFGRWSASLEYGWSQNRLDGLTDQAFPATTAAATAAFRAIAFRDNVAFPPTGLDPFLTIQRINFGNRNLLQDGAFRFGGPIIGLPGGDLTVTSLVEYRTERASSDPQLSITGTAGATRRLSFTPPATRQTRSAYAEFQAPLIGPANSVPFVHELTLLGSVRYEDARVRAAQNVLGPIAPAGGEVPLGPFPDPVYIESEAEAESFTFGARFSPTPGIVFRASYGTGVLLPRLTDLRPSTLTPNPVTSTTFFGITDPLRGNTPLIGDANGQITLAQAGNPDLVPERSRSWSAGVIFSPSFMDGLRISADFTEIRKRDEIITLSAALPLQEQINFEGELPGLVERGPRLANDPAGWAGPIIFLRRGSFNATRALIRAVDLQADYRLRATRFGNLHFYVNATRPLDLARQASPSAPFVNRVGFSDGPLRWRLNGGLNWDSGNWSAGWNLQYFNSYSICASTATTTICDAQTTSQGARIIPSQIYNDLYVRYRFGRSSPALAGTEIMISVQNVLDARPPLIATTLNGHSLFGDPRLRRFTIGFRRSFGRGQ